MSRLYKPATQEGYRIAAALLQLNLNNNVVEIYCQREGKSKEETQEISAAIKRLAESLYRRGESYE